MGGGRQCNARTTGNTNVLPIPVALQPDRTPARPAGSPMQAPRIQQRWHHRGSTTWQYDMAVFLPSHLRPRPGTASAVGRLSIGRLVGEQCNFDQSSIVARMSSRAMQNGRSWVKKRNLGQKNATLARKTGFSALLLSVSIERGGGIRENFLGLANNSFAPHRWFSEKVLRVAQ